MKLPNHQFLHLSNQSKNVNKITISLEFIYRFKIYYKESIVGEDRYLEIQDMERSKNRSHNKKGLKAMMNTEESQDPLHHVEESGNVSDQSEYLDKVNMLDD